MHASKGKPRARPPEERGAIQRQDGKGLQQQRAQVIAAEASFSGPIPPPAMLEQYQRLVPDAPERILRMAEKNQEHRQALEAKVIPARVARERWGQIFGFIIALSVIALGGSLLAYDKSVTGLTLILGALVALVSVFVYTDRAKRKDLAEKREVRPPE